MKMSYYEYIKYLAWTWWNNADFEIPTEYREEVRNYILNNIDEFHGALPQKEEDINA